MVERGREDDTEESIKVRLDVYRDETLPLIKFYDDKDVLKTVDAFGDIDEIFNLISGLMKT
jgi:adenylate kinase